MSTLGSSVINKSGKKFAPKAPIRRGAAPSSTQTSARPSVDRQLQSQTPQPPALRQNAAPSPAPASVPDPTASQQPRTAAEPAVTLRNDASTLIPIPTHKAGASSTTSLSVPVALPAPQQNLPQPAPRSTPQPTSQPNPQPTPQPTSQATAQPIARPLPQPTAQPTPRPTSSVTPQSISQPTTQPTPQPTPQSDHPSAVSASVDQPQPSIEQATIISTDQPHASNVPTPVATSKAPKPKTKRTPAKKSVSASTSSNPSAPPTEKSTDVTTTSARASDSVPPTRIEREDVSASQPPAKRRRIERPRPASTQDEVATTNDNTSVPIATIEHENVGEVVQTTEADGPSSVPPKTKKPKRSVKEKGKNGLQARAQAMAEEIVADATRKETEQAGPPKEPGRRGRRRVPTPENAEVVEIAPGLVKMADLCKDLRTGKKSKRETALQELDWTEVVRKQRERKRAVAAGEMPPPETVDEMLERVGRERAREQEMAQAVPNTIIVNGEIQLDQSSLQIDRHAQAQAERDAEQMEVVDESEITRRVNAGSWLKREKTESWDEENTDLFYNGLRMFGTDFEMISKMFPGRTRRAIKLKFTKEEKLDKNKIKDTLLGERLPVDMALFEKLSNTIYKDPKELEREMEEDRKRLEEEQAKEREAMDEALAQRAAEAAAEGAAVGNDSSAKENEFGGERAPAKGKRGRKAGAKKKAGRGKGAVGGEVEVLGPLDGTAQQLRASVEA